MKLFWHILGLISQVFGSPYVSGTVSDICGPSTNQSLAQRLQAAQWAASDWLLDERRPDQGWNFASTGSAILSLHLANETWKANPLPLEMQLTIKQLEIELLRDLSHRRHLKEMSMGQLAFYAMALDATCHDSSDFHGHDVMRQLRHRVAAFQPNETHNFMPYSLSLLALCSSGQPVPESAVENLKQAQRDDGCFKLGIDVTSVALMAMSCMRPHLNTAEDLSLLRQMMKYGTHCIVTHQNGDGGFNHIVGTNIITTALAAEALIATGIPPSRWRCEQTLSLILDAQHPDGHFGSQAATIQILPLLSNRHHGSLTEIEQECPASDQLEVISSIGGRDETISVYLEFHLSHPDLVGSSNPVETLVVMAIPGESLFRVMERARQTGHLPFETKMTQFGNLIISIMNIESDNAAGFHWYIHEVQGTGDVALAQTGPEGIYPVDNSSYRWVYRQYVP